MSILIDRILNLLWDFFKKPDIDIRIKDTQVISGSEVRELLSRYTNNLWISDGVFRLVCTQDIQDFLRRNSVSTRRYITDFHDCDDYSYELMGDVSTWHSELAFGMVWGNRAVDGEPHAWNFYIDEEQKIKFVEPQNDNIFNPTSEKIWVMII